MGTTAFFADLVMLAVGLHLFVNANPQVLAAKLRRPGAWALIAGATVFRFVRASCSGCSLVGTGDLDARQRRALGRICSDGMVATKSSARSRGSAHRSWKWNWTMTAVKMDGDVLTGTFRRASNCRTLLSWTNC